MAQGSVAIDFHKFGFIAVGAAMRSTRPDLGERTHLDKRAQVDLTMMQEANLKGANLKHAVFENMILDKAELDGLLVEKTRFDRVGFEKLDIS